MSKRRLTIGMRAKFKPANDGNTSFDEYVGNECLLKERSSGGDFSVMVLGQKELKKKDPKTVINEVAWVNEDELEFINAKFKTNLDFMDWYQEHHDLFCGDCGTWFPQYGAWDPETEEDYLCPNEKCPGRLYESGNCPFCDPAVNLDDDDKCPECGWKMNR